MQEDIQNILSELCELLKLKYEKLEFSETENGVKLNIISAEDGSMFIGKHGDNLFALQVVLTNLLEKKLEKRVSLRLDVENYKINQEKNILELAERKAIRIQEKGGEELMPPLSPYLRRLVHLHFVENEKFPYIKTMSVGDDDNRQVKLYKPLSI
jgi:spoIIIJ-associated protein